MERQECINILADVIKINSENGNEKEVALYYQNLLKKHNIKSELIEYDDKRASLVAEISNGCGRNLAISGHMDVVSAGDENEWTYPPFDAHIDEDEVMWGRGASDMKPGLSALVIAFIELNESKNFKGKLRLMATVGEEVGQLGAKQLTDLGYLKDIDAVLIAEPCNVGVTYAHKGSLNYKVISKGIQAHSSMPELGQNAVEHLSEAMHEITKNISEEASKYKNDVLGQTFNNITVINGGKQVNSIPEHAEFEANARTIPEFDNEKLISLVKETIDKLNKKDGYDLKLEVTSDLSPVETNANSELIKTISLVASRHENLLPRHLFKQMNDVLGPKFDYLFKDMEDNFDLDNISPIVISGTTDAAQFMNGNKNLDIAVYGPGMPMLNHKVDERIPLAQYIDFIDAYIEIFEEYLK